MTRVHPTSAGRPGWTLIELLVVLGLIGTLFGLTVPAVMRARGAAARVQDQNNLRQLGLAMQAYTNSHGGTLPPALSRELGRDRWWFGEATLSGERWFYRYPTPDPPEVDTSRGHLSPYLEGVTLRDPLAGAGGEQARYRGATGGYGYNYQYLAPVTFVLPAWEPVWTPVRLEQVRNPSQTVAFTNSAGVSVDLTTRDALLIEVGLVEPPSGNYPSVHFRHAGGVANVAFVDGHVEARTDHTRNPVPDHVPPAVRQLRDRHRLFDLGADDRLWDRD
jgi:prepilin-type processing-associated H-X9-DG protein